MRSYRQLRVMGEDKGGLATGSKLETGDLSAAVVGDVASLPRWWRRAGIRTLGYLLNAASHSFFKNSA